jgi:hypothetical protein
VTEKEMRKSVVGVLTNLMAFSVENSVGAGMGDIACTLGWIELKVGDRPKREDTRVVFSMRPSQRTWHRQWRERGGRSWTLSYLHAGRDMLGVWLLHDGAWSADHMDLVDEQVLVSKSIGSSIELTGAILTKWLLRPTIYVKD